MKRWAYRVEIYAGGWVDITDDVRGDLTITRGRSGEGYRADPGKCSFRLDNRSGRYSPRNPASDLYGLIGKNTAVRVSAGPIAGTLVGRFHGEIPAWPPRWSLSGNDRYVDLVAAGLLRRFRQGDQPAYSSMRRTLAASDPLAYWPIEDGEDSSQVGSALSGASPLTITGTVPTFREIETWTEEKGYAVRYGTAALADISAGSTLSAAVPPSATAATTTGWTVAVAADVDLTGASGDLVVMEVATTGGTYPRWQMVLTPSRTQIIAYTAGGTATTLVDDASVFLTMVPHNLTVWQDGANIRCGYHWDTGSYEATGVVAGTLAGITSITINPGGVTATNPMLVGHLAVWAGHGLDVIDFDDGPMVLSLFGYAWTGLSGGTAQNGEPANVRLARITAEEGVTITGPAAPAGSDIAAGVQSTATFDALLDETIAVDGGMLYEDRDVLALSYRPRATLYNQTPVTIAYAGQTTEPFDPVDDVDDVRNDITVSRPNGSSARAMLTTGPLAAVQPPAGVGVYKEAPTVNVNADDQLADQAGWRLHLGTVDEPRYPAITVQLSAPAWVAAPSLRAQLLALDVGDVLEVTGLPEWVSGRVRTLVTGYTETVGEFLWSITFNGVPASPWDIAEADGDLRVPADGTVLSEAVPNATWGSFKITSTAENGAWTTDAADFPLLVRVGGEVMEVSTIGGTGLNQTAIVSTRGVHGGARSWPTGTAVDVYEPAVAPL